jgi:hypothetical protein
MAYDPDLPYPAATDVDHNRAGNPARWTCRYCGFTETGPLTTDAEARRCRAHEYRCPSRPADNVPTGDDRAVYQAVHAAGLRRDLLALPLHAGDREGLLRRTWIVEFRRRRALRAEIRRTRGRIADILARAKALGIDDGWHDYFPPEETDWNDHSAVG